MEEIANDPWLNAIFIALLLASCVTWLYLVSNKLAGRPFLQYAPRRPVPWGAPVAMVGVVFMALSLLAAIAAPETAADDGMDLGAVENGQRLLSMIVVQCLLFGGVLAFVRVVYRADLADLGLPTYLDELLRDVRLGVLTWLASLLPVYGVQIIVAALLGPSHHPIVEMVTSGGPEWGVVLLATVAAAVVAPIGEEILFRLLLQGWLEKWEQRRWRPLADAASVNDRHADALAPVEPAESASVPGDAPEGVAGHVAPEPLPLGVAGLLPYGWLPIVISSLCFAAAHFGYGPDPIPIFVLALILGYVYQRTHRIVPCIVAHALFNSIAMLMLWRLVWLQSGGDGP